MKRAVERVTNHMDNFILNHKKFIAAQPVSKTVKDDWIAFQELFENETTKTRLNQLESFQKSLKATYLSALVAAFGEFAEGDMSGLNLMNQLVEQAKKKRIIIDLISISRRTS